MKALRITLLLAGIVGVLICLAIPSMPGGLSSTKSGETTALINQVNAACVQYKVEYGALPPSENRRLAPILIGDNPRKIAFMEILPRHLNEKGEILDAWGTPLRITCRANDLVVIESAGSDGLFGTKDDFTTLK